MLGGGPSARALHDRAIARGVPLHSTYGMTETSSQVATGRRAIGDAATLANARWQANELLKRSAILRKAVDDGAIEMLVGIYDVDTGRVRFVD